MWNLPAFSLINSSLDIVRVQVFCQVLPDFLSGRGHLVVDSPFCHAMPIGKRCARELFQPFAQEQLSLAQFSVVADRYAYLSNIGICFLVVCVFLRWYTIVNLKWRWVPATVFGIYIACLSIYSFQYVRTWHSAYTVKKRLKETIEQRSDFNQLRNKIKGNETE